jgi:hypothetical protein
MGIDFCVTINDDLAKGVENNLRQILADLGLMDKVRVE